MAISMTLGAILLAAIMLSGWGWASLRLCGQGNAGWPETMALGLGAVVFLGGILNLARLAYPWAIATVAAAGIILGILALRERRPERPPVLETLLIAILVLFTIATQLPPAVYNFHDDFQKYFAYCARMLQTGTVFGSPLSAIGEQTLGAKAFLDGFVASFFPIVYLNGVDAVFGLLLCLLLATRFGGSAALCILTVFAINPQYVNSSALYLGAALIMAIASFGMAGSAAAIGLLYAALIALKPTFLIFVAIHLAAMALGEGLRWAWRAGLATALFLSPWLLLHAPHYWAALLHRRPPPPHVPGQVLADHIRMFSWKPLDFGDSAMHFTLLMAAVALCGCLARRAPSGKRMLAFCFTGVAAYLVFVYVFSPVHAGYEHSIRYFCPIAIGMAAPALGWVGASFKNRGWLLAALVVALFFPSMTTRMRRAMSDHSIAAYNWLSREPDYIAFSHRVTSPRERASVKAMQELIPAGEPVLAWTADPFYFDYRRNRIIDIDPAGIGAPWADVPSAKYLILDYDGYPTPAEADYREDALDVGAGERRNAEYTLEFLRRVRAMAANGKVLFDNKEVKVVKIRD